VEPVPENRSEEPPPLTRVERTRQRLAALQSRRDAVAARAQAERSNHASLDAVYEMVDRDGEFAGGIIAGALAYRLFIWLLPLGLVFVAGLGIASDAASSDPKTEAKSLGIAGLVSNSVAGAAEGHGRWYALLIGIPLLLVATRSVLRVLIGIHRIIWGDVRDSVPKPTLVAATKLLVIFVGCFAVAGAGTTARAHAPGFGLLITLVIALPYAGFWLLATTGLPHRGSSWTALLPGAVLFGICIEVLNILAAYVLGPYAIAKQGTYGALGTAAVLLLALFFFSRVIVVAALVNATLWERRLRGSGSVEAPIDGGDAAP
jgi:uncharacterized BrkB/YihY/UPF0761 family membrane protein